MATSEGRYIWLTVDDKTRVEEHNHIAALIDEGWQVDYKRQQLPGSASGRSLWMVRLSRPARKRATSTSV